MNAAACQQALEGVGAGVAASLRAVDCAAGATAQAAFGRLFGTDGALLPALTILLTLYVAFFAFALITGRSRIGVAALTPRMITVGLVLTFATSWIAYQSVVWNLAVGAPDQIAGILMGTRGSATTLFADKIDVVFAALIEAGGSQGGEAATTAFSPPGLMWLGAMLLLLGTVGLLATCKIALAILLALGPVFVVLALFPSTRGLFTGWLKGVVMLAITPLFAVLGGTLMLELAVPVLRSLVQTPGTIDARAAMAFFMIGAVHAALMIMVLKVAGSMVAGWTVFGLAGGEGARGDKPMTEAPRREVVPALAGTSARPAVAASPATREIRVATATPSAANDRGGVGPASVHRDTRFVSGAAVSAAAPASSARSRTRGLGNRFRSPVRPMEKFK